MASSKASSNGQAAESAAITPRQATVVLGGKEFTIYALPMKAARQWRADFAQPLQDVLEVLRHMQQVELRDVGQAAEVLQQVGTYVLGSVDLLVEALFAYSPELASQREWIENHADDTEAMAAVWQVLKLAFPFGQILQLVRGANTIGT